MDQAIIEYSIILIFAPYLVVIFWGMIIMAKDKIFDFIALFK